LNKPELQELCLQTGQQKAVLALLKANNLLEELNELKAQSCLSNKKWDKTFKGLTKKELAKVEKTDDGLTVKLF